MAASGLPEAPESALAALGRGATVVTATRRLARHLRARHDESRRREGLGAWASPDVLPWDAWLQRLVAEAERMGAGPLPQPLGSPESALLWRQLIAAEGGPDPGDAGLLARLATTGAELCALWDISPDQLRQEARSADSTAFADWSRAYARRCRELDRLDLAALPVRLAALPPALLRALAGQEISFAGFDLWPPARQGLAAALAAAGVRTHRAEGPRLSGPGRRVPCRDEREELALAAHWARHRLEEDPGATIGVVIPDLAERGAEVRRIFLDVLVPGWQLHPRPIRPLSVSLGRALGDYPVIHAALLVLRLLAGPVPWQEASLLLRSRHLGPAAAETVGRARAELALRAQPAQVLEARDLVALCARDAPGFGAALEAVVQEATRSPRQLPGAWAARIGGWLGRLGWPGEGPPDSDGYQARQAWQRLLESYAGWSALLGAHDLGTAVDILCTEARDQVFEPEGQEAGVQVLGTLEAAGLAFDHLWICGLTADAWPPPPRPHPLLPLGLQRQRGIPEATAAGSLALAEERFARLRGAAPQVTGSWPGLRKDEELVMSPFLQSLPEVPGDTAAGPSWPSDRARVAASAVPEAAVEDPPPPWPGHRPVPGGARVLSLQSACPARAFAEIRLAARELQVPEGPLNGAMRGNLAHDLLAALYGEGECRQGLAPVAPQRLRELVARHLPAVMDRYLGRPDAVTRRLRSLEGERLQRLVLALRSLDEGRSIQQVAAEVERTVTVGPLVLQVRLDRLDGLTAGDLVLDYKTGQASPKGWRAERLGDCQLPLYSMTAAAGEPVAAIAYLHLDLPEPWLEGVGDPALGLGDAGIIAPEKFFRNADVPDWPATLARWESQLGQLAREFAGGDFRVNPRQPRREQGQFVLLTRAHGAGAALAGEDDGAGEPEP